MILFLDNYDSFVYNLYQLIGNEYPDIEVVRNDALRWPAPRWRWPGRFSPCKSKT